MSECIDNGYGRWIILYELEKRTNDRRKQYHFKNIGTGEIKTTTIRQLKRMKPYTVSITHGMSTTPTYMSWKSMKARCYDINNHKYPEYAGRGIVVCDEWIDSFENFYQDMGERPAGFTLDRKDNNKGYSPDNCRWATPKQQANNRRKRRAVPSDVQY